MLLKSITLENIRSYIRQTLDFPEGSILLSGDIGSGKTTILLGIEFAIFGSRRGELSAASLLRHGALQGSVELRLDLSGRDVAIKRVLKKGKNGITQDAGFITLDGVKTEMTPLELKAKILEMIGYPDELVSKNKSLIFRYTVYTPQEEMKSILFEDPEERLTTLRKIFGIDKYQRVQENAELYLRNVRQQRKLLNAKLEDVPNLEQRYITVKNEKNFLVVERDKAQMALKEAQAAYNVAKEKKGKLEQQVQNMRIVKQELSFAELSLKEKKERFNGLKSRRQELNNEVHRVLGELQKFPKDLPAPEQITVGINRLEQMLSSVQKSLALVAQEIRVKETELTLLSGMRLDALRTSCLEKKNHFTQLQARKAALDAGILETDKEIDDIKAKLQSFELSLKNALNTKNKISQIEKCPLCLQNVDHGHKQHIIEEQDNTLRILMPQKVALENNLDLRLKHKSSLVVQQQIFQKAETDAARAEAELKGIEEKLARVQQLAIDILTLKQRKEALSHEPVDTWQKEKKGMQDLLGLLSSHKELVRQEKLLKGQVKTIDEEELILGNGISELVGRISFLSKRASELDVLKEYEELLVMESSLERQVHEFTVISTERDKEYGFAELQLHELERTLADKKRITLRLHYYHDLEHWLSESFLKLAQTIERQLFVQIHHEFSEVFSNWFSLLMEEENLTVRLDENFTPLLEQNGYETEVANLSGGEKTAVALAYRLALNRVINDVMSTIKTRDILILDEPTDGFSSEQLDKMRDVLTLLKVKQLIMVSHETKMESLVHHIIRVHKEHHQSRLD